MIRSFADKRTEEFYRTGRAPRLPPELCRRARRKMDFLDYATCPDDLKVPPGNRLHKLAGDRKGQYAISVNDQWRFCFRFEDGDVHDVELTDYHS